MAELPSAEPADDITVAHAICDSSPWARLRRLLSSERFSRLV
jgi:hypothetical protein